MILKNTVSQVVPKLEKICKYTGMLLQKEIGTMMVIRKELIWTYSIAKENEVILLEAGVIWSS